ncbi:hypothetical protein SAMN05421640_0898 [Ekhidna lutea]|uniref:Uncharacterized protein n=1 Tax=Ekhidna lutea TaxID=447679 RepID=A0A239GLV8_EKHLU|nr:hypothetical protein [Ekhidna lutea]SNS69802.1 hypothetical protein SAMN05421640_0898 [Ekhidna lutea]
MKTLFISTLFLLSLCSWAQDERLDEKIDQITYDWDLEADKLSNYSGLQQLCTDEAYRGKILHLLNEIHHYDSVLYDVLVKLSKKSKDKEIKKTLKDIKKFEEEYDTKSFVHFMNEECKAMREIERESEVTSNDVGINSYSGQVYILETELFKYVKHVTARVDKIRLHVHHLSKHYN